MGVVGICGFAVCWNGTAAYLGQVLRYHLVPVLQIFLVIEVLPHEVILRRRATVLVEFSIGAEDGDEELAIA